MDAKKGSLRTPRSIALEKGTRPEGFAGAMNINFEAGAPAGAPGTNGSYKDPEDMHASDRGHSARKDQAAPFVITRGRK